MSIEAERCLFIRLGKSGEWTEQCISAGQLRLDYPQVSHEFCLAGRWTQVESQDRATEQRSRRGRAAYQPDSRLLRSLRDHAVDHVSRGLHVVVLREPQGHAARGRYEGGAYRDQ